MLRSVSWSRLVVAPDSNMVKRLLPAHKHMRGGLAGDEQKSYLSILCDSASFGLACFGSR